MDALESDLFYNRKLGRRLSREDVKEALEFLRKDGRAEWLGVLLTPRHVRNSKNKKVNQAT